MSLYSQIFTFILVVNGGFLAAQDLSRLRVDVTQLEILMTAKPTKQAPFRVVLERASLERAFHQVPRKINQTLQAAEILRQISADLRAPTNSQVVSDLQSERNALAAQLNALIPEPVSKDPVPVISRIEIDQLTSLIEMIDDELQQSRLDDQLTENAIRRLQQQRGLCDRLYHLADAQASRLNWAAMVYAQILQASDPRSMPLLRFRSRTSVHSGR